jgi:hypothetical protein
MPTVALTGWLPDADPTTPGVLVDVTNMTPSVRGYRGATTPEATTAGTLAAKCHGAAAFQSLDGSTVRTFAGTQTKLYELLADVWTDQSRVAAMDIGAAGAWRFAQFGDTTLAANKTVPLQAIDTGDFADLTAPQASCIDVSQGFVMLADTSDGTYGDSPDRWWCSAYLDHTDWTPSISTQCTTGRLVDSPGKITAIKAMGSGFVAYKDKAMFLGQYAGPPAVWQWTQIPGEVGCANQEAIASISPSVHIFVGREDFYIFDGTRPQSIGEGVREWFFNTALDKQYRSSIRVVHDRDRTLVKWFYPSATSAGVLDSMIAYNYKTNKWGKATISIEAAIEYQTPNATIDGASGTFDSRTEYYDSPLFAGGAPFPAIINTSHNLMLLTGASASSGLTTWSGGDDVAISTLRMVRPRLTNSPTSATLTSYHNSNPDGSFATGETVSMNAQHNFDVLQSARWHKVSMAFVGDVEITGINFDFAAGGKW